MADYSPELSSILISIKDAHDNLTRLIVDLCEHIQEKDPTFNIVIVSLLFA